MQMIKIAPPAAPISFTNGAAFTTTPFSTIEEGEIVNLNLPGSNVMNGVPFKVRASGYFSCPAQTVTATSITGITLDAQSTYGNSGTVDPIFTPTNGIPLGFATLPSFTLSSAVPTAIMWQLEANLLAVTGRYMSGVTSWWVEGPNELLIKSSVFTAVENLVFVNDMTLEPPIQFAPTLTAFSSTANFSFTAYLSQLVLEA
jgi:hypothetical protein